MNNGTASVEAIEPNARAYAVQKTVSTKISQTWLASQMGPIASAMAFLCRTARGPTASKSHMPPPKSAPPIRAYRINDSNMKMATVSSSMG